MAPTKAVAKKQYLALKATLTKLVREREAAFSAYEARLTPASILAAGREVEKVAAKMLLVIEQGIGMAAANKLETPAKLKQSVSYAKALSVELNSLKRENNKLAVRVAKQTAAAKKVAPKPVKKPVKKQPVQKPVQKAEKKATPKTRNTRVRAKTPPAKKPGKKNTRKLHPKLTWWQRVRK